MSSSSKGIGSRPGWRGEHDGDDAVRDDAVRDDAARDDAAIAALLRRAGRRPQVPADVMAEVKEAARSQWRWTLRVEKRRRRLRAGGVVGGLLAAAAALLLTIGLPPRSAPAGPIATVEAVASVGQGLLEQGQVVSGQQEPGGRLPVPGETLDAGTVLETGGSRLALRLLSGVGLRLDIDTRIRLEGVSSLELLRGAVYADAGGASPSSERQAVVAVRTELGTVRDLGTRFATRLDSEGSMLEVLVRDGSVELEHGQERTVAVGGEALRLAADGSLSRRPIATSGPLWDWTLSALPPFEADGRTLHAFLAWAAHEGGWRLRYASPELESAAASLTLHGSIAGLSLQEALELTLLGTGLELSARTEADELLIESPAARPAPGRPAPGRPAT